MHSQRQQLSVSIFSGTAPEAWYTRGPGASQCRNGGWADYVDERVTRELAHCGHLLKEDPRVSFAIDLIVGTGDETWHWAAWLNFSPVGPPNESELRVLVDSNAVVFNEPLKMQRIAVRSLEPHALVSRSSDPPGMVLRCQDGYCEWVPRAKAIQVPVSPPRPYDRTRALAEELRRRHQGRGLFEEPDGVLGFVVDFASPNWSKSISSCASAITTLAGIGYRTSELVEINLSCVARLLRCSAALVTRRDMRLHHQSPRTGSSACGASVWKRSQIAAELGARRGERFAGQNRVRATRNR